MDCGCVLASIDGLSLLLVLNIMFWCKIHLGYFGLGGCRHALKMIEHTAMRAGQQSIIELRLHSVKQCDYLTGADNHSPKPMLPVMGG